MPDIFIKVSDSQIKRQVEIIENVSDLKAKYEEAKLVYNSLAAERADMVKSQQEVLDYFDSAKLNPAKDLMDKYEADISQIKADTGVDIKAVAVDVAPAEDVPVDVKP